MISSSGDLVLMLYRIVALLSLLTKISLPAHTDALSPSKKPPTSIRHASTRRSRFGRLPRLWRSSPSTAPSIVSIPLNASEQDIHVQMMEYALDEARQAGRMGEVPIGAIVVRELTTRPPQLSSQQPQATGTSDDTTPTRHFEIISAGRNLVETKMDASAHAELEAMKAAASQLGNWRLLNATLFSTLEPCPMCLAAAQAFRCKSVVYGAPDLRLGAVKTHIQLLEMAKHPYHEVEAIGGVLEEESAALLRDFFRARRKQSESRTGIHEDSNNGGTLRSRITGLALRVIKQLNPFRHLRQ
mmetsp:Transcript_7258/g.15844  ORF Transcript_7258/g.15844 Transcript_7258/m.15844 type:complete len:300 (+) Transcript_7258:381-1280(+)